MYYPSIPPSQLDDLRRWLETELNNLGIVYNGEIEELDKQVGLRETAGTGVIEGGLLIIDAFNTINIGAGAGEIVDGYTDRRAPTVTNVIWPDTLGFVIDMPDTLGIQVIYVDEDGIIHQQANSLTPTQRRHNVQLGFVSYDSGIVETAAEGGIWSNEVANVLYDWIYFTPAANRIQGMGIHPTLTNLSIWGETGQLLSPGIDIESSLTDANILPFNAVGDENTPATFRIVYSDGSMHSLNQTIMPDLYEVSPGVTDTIIGNHAVIHYIYRTHGNDIIVQLGQTSYTDAKLARDSLEVDRQGYTYFTNAEQTLLSAQSYHGAQASDYDDPNAAGIVSLIGSGSNPSGGINITEFLALLDVYATTYTGNAGNLVTVNPEETGLIFTDPVNIDEFVLKSGDTMTGDLVINYDATPRLTIKPAATGGWPQLQIQDNTGDVRGSLFVTNDSGILSLRQYAAGGATETTVSLTTDGNVTVSGALPTDVAHLTRKDYVDGTTVSITGDTMTGTLSLPDLPVEPEHATRADWVISMIGTGLIYKGLWDALTNTPPLADGIGTEGNFYIVDVAGSQDLGSGLQTFAVDDLVIYNIDLIWQGHKPRSDYVLKSGDTMTGALTVNQTLHGRRYVEVGNYDLTADKMQSYFRDQVWYINSRDAANLTQSLTMRVNGQIVLTDAAPTAVDHVTRKDYVDDTTVSITGDTMTGDLLLNNATNSNQIKSFAADQRTIISGGVTATSANGAYISLEAKDYGGAGLGGTLHLIAGAGKTVTAGIITSSVAPTAAAHLTRKDYVDNQAYGGKVGSGQILPPGWTVSNHATGQYTVTHTLNSQAYGLTVSLNWNASSENYSIIPGYNSNTSFEVRVRNAIGTLVNANWMFTMVKI